MNPEDLKTTLHKSFATIHFYQFFDLLSPHYYPAKVKPALVRFNVIKKKKKQKKKQKQKAKRKISLHEIVTRILPQAVVHRKKK